MDQAKRIRSRKYSQTISRQSRVKSKRQINWHFPRVNAIAVLSGIALIAFGWYVFGSGHFKITTILIQGSLNDAVSHDLQSLKGKNIVLLSVRSYEEELPKRQSSLKSLHIVKGFPDTLKIDVSVREPIIVWKSGDKQYYLDSSGVAFTLEGIQTKVDDASLAKVTDSKSQPVEVGDQLVPRSFITFINQLSGEFKQKGGSAITGISIEETTRFVDVSTDSNITVKLDTTRSLDPQLAALAAVLNQYRSDIHQYVDLRVEGRAFYQ